LTALLFTDLTVEPDGSAPSSFAGVRQDQEGVGAVVPVPADAMAHLVKWVTAARISSGPLFRSVRHGGGSVGGALDAGDVSRIFKNMATRARLSAENIAQISGHSARIGGAQDMLRYEETLPAIMTAGRWKNPEMAGRYVAKVAARDSAAKRIADQRDPF
jgi:integrase